MDFHGQKRTNETHSSKTDPEAKLYRKGRGKESKRAHMGHMLSENRNGLIVAITATEANGTAERDAALGMLGGTRNHTPTQARDARRRQGPLDDGRLFQLLELVGIEPHIPLVKDPVDPKTVSAPKRVPGVKARRRMKRRMKIN